MAHTNTDQLTIAEARQIAALFPNVNQSWAPPATNLVPHPFEIGKNYFIRTVTYHCTGRLVAVFAGELLLEKAAWIADSGRFHDAVTKGTFNEVEPFGTEQQVIIGRGSIIDACQIATLPVSQK